MKTLKDLWDTHDRLCALHDHNSDTIGMLEREIEDMPVIHSPSVNYWEYADMDTYYELTAEIDELEEANKVIDDQLVDIESQIDQIKSRKATGA